MWLQRNSSDNFSENPVINFKVLTIFTAHYHWTTKDMSFLRNGVCTLKTEIKYFCMENNFFFQLAKLQGKLNILILVLVVFCHEIVLMLHC